MKWLCLHFVSSIPTVITIRIRKENVNCKSLFNLLSHRFVAWIPCALTQKWLYAVVRNLLRSSILCPFVSCHTIENTLEDSNVSSLSSAWKVRLGGSGKEENICEAPTVTRAGLYLPGWHSLHTYLNCFPQNIGRRYDIKELRLAKWARMSEWGSSDWGAPFETKLK